jgi:phosphate transport system substrate-binding protein
VGYVPLGKDHYDLAIKNFKAGKVGTGFGGKAEVGVTLDDLLQREAKL